MTQEQSVKPTVEEIMRFNELNYKGYVLGKEFTNEEAVELNELELKTQGFDMAGILFDEIKSLREKLNVAIEALREVPIVHGISVEDENLGPVPKANVIVFEALKEIGE